MPEDGLPLRRLTKRAQFLAAARGRRAGRDAFVLQMIPSTCEGPGIGFTVTRKTGNAVVRNRIRRRLRAASRACAAAFQTRHDYVLVGRRQALGADFAALTRDLNSAIRRVHKPKSIPTP